MARSSPAALLLIAVILGCEHPKDTTAPPDSHVVMLASFAGEGTGRIVSEPAAIDCRKTAAGTVGTCSAAVAVGGVELFRAEPDEQSLFMGWSAGCGGLGQCHPWGVREDLVAGDTFNIRAFLWPTSRSGLMHVEVTGLPDGVWGRTTTRSPDISVTWLGSLEGTMPAGDYTIEAAPVTDAGGTAYTPLVESRTVTVTPGSTPVMVQVAYSPAPPAGTSALGTLNLSVEGLPVGAQAPIEVQGPDGFADSVSASATFRDLSRGSYSVAADSVVVATTVYKPTPLAQSVAVTPGGVAAARVRYAPAPSGLVRVDAQIGGAPNSTVVGAGRIVSEPAGIDCSQDLRHVRTGTCSASFAAGTTVRFTATPAEGSSFYAFEPLTCGTGPVCTLVIGQPFSIYARIAPPRRRFTLELSGPAGSLVDPSHESRCAITAGNATATCAYSGDLGERVYMVTSPALGAVVEDWGVTCSPAALGCTFLLTADTTVHVRFRAAADASAGRKFALSVRGAGAGEGFVSGVQPPSSSGEEEHCFVRGTTVASPTCGADRAAGEKVVLRALPEPNSKFVRWGGNCSGTAITCAVTMNAARDVTVEFATASTGGGSDGGLSSTCVSGPTSGSYRCIGSVNGIDFFWRVTSSGGQDEALMRLINTTGGRLHASFAPLFPCANGANRQAVANGLTVGARSMQSGELSGLWWFPCAPGVAVSGIRLTNVTVRAP